MIEVIKIKKDVYKVTQVDMSFSDTKKKDWFWDLANKLISEREDFPRTLETRDMTTHNVNWFKKYYLSKIQ